MFRNAKDSEKLIEEVRKRPALYEGLGQTANPATRRAHWQDIAKDLFHGVWDTSSANEKEALAREVQVKWKSLRDSYNKDKRLQKEELQKGSVKIRKQYIFRDKLRFLDLAGRSTSPGTILISDDLDLNEGEMISSDDASRGDQEMLEARPSTTVSNNEDGTKTDNALADLLGELVKIQKDQVDDRMGNKKFLLSLLPFMEKLPDDVNLEVRLQLMSVLQTYSSGDSFMKV